MMFDMTKIRLLTPAEREAIRVKAEARAKAEMAPILRGIDQLVTKNAELRAALKGKL
jgi:hypothetical protein